MSGNGLGGILEIESGKNEALKALRSWDEIPNGEEGKEKTSHTLKPRLYAHKAVLYFACMHLQYTR